MALSMMRMLEGVTGMDILGRAEEHAREKSKRDKIAAMLSDNEENEPWKRWRRVEATVLKKGECVIMDGATGTEIERLAGPESMNRKGWTCNCNFTYPEYVQEVHLSYLNAGADMITANTYATNANVMDPAGAGLGKLAEKATAAGVRIAKKARLEYLCAAPEGTRVPLVAGSLSCHPPNPEEGVAWDNGEWPPPDVEERNITAHANLLSQQGVDVIIVELVWDADHGERALKAACATGLPVILSLSLPVPPNGPVMDTVRNQLANQVPVKLGGLGESTLADALVRFTAGRTNIVAVCIHRTPISIMPHALAAVRSVWTGPLGAYPELGRWQSPHWIHENMSIDEYVSHMEVWVQSHGVQMIGGCCGVGPHYIRALNDTFRKPREPEPQQQQQQQQPTVHADPTPTIPTPTPIPAPPAPPVPVPVPAPPAPVVQGAAGVSAEGPRRVELPPPPGTLPAPPRPVAKSAAPVPAAPAPASIAPAPTPATLPPPNPRRNSAGAPKQESFGFNVGFDFDGLLRGSDAAAATAAPATSLFPSPATTTTALAGVGAMGAAGALPPPPAGLSPLGAGGGCGAGVPASASGSLVGSTDPLTTESPEDVKPSGGFTGMSVSDVTTRTPSPEGLRQQAVARLPSDEDMR